MERIIPIEPIKQESLFDCGPACARMLAYHLNVNGEINEVNNRLERVNNKVNLFDLACAITGGWKIEVGIIRNSGFINGPSENWIECSIKRSEKTSARSESKTIDASLLRSIIDQGRPIITLISVERFRNVKLPARRGHFILLKGFTEHDFVINDPHPDPDKFGERRVEQIHLIESITSTKYPAILFPILAVNTEGRLCNR